MTLKDRVQLTLINHPHLQDNDRMLVADIYTQMHPDRFAFNQFLRKYADGLIPTEKEILSLKDEFINQLKTEENEKPV